MKLLRIISSLNPSGGGPISAAQTIDSQLEFKGHTVETLCLDSPDAEFLKSYKRKCYAIGPSVGGYSFNRNMIPWLKANAQNFDAVLIDGLWQYHSFGAWRALKKLKIPYFVFVHGMLGPWFKKEFPLKHVKKWLYWPWAEYRVLRDAAGVIYTCEEERRLAKESFWLYRAHEKVCPLGVQAPSNAIEYSTIFLEKFPELKNKRFLLFLGRLHDIKGCDILLYAFSKIAKENKLHLVMAGPKSPESRVDLIDLAKKLGIAENVTWTGSLNDQLKWGALHSCEALCLPSHHENFGMVIAEAMSCSKPVLISNKVNIWKEIDSYSAGLIDDDTIEGTLRNLQGWLKLDRTAYGKMSSQAKICFTEKFHINQVADCLIKIIQEA